MYQLGGSLTITRVMVVDNHSNTWGGGIYTTGSASELLTVIDSTFSGNTAATNGGALAGVGPMTIVNTTFSGNTAAQGGALDIWGWYSYVTITNSTITNNTASTTGGGIYDEITVGYINLQNSIVAGNDGGDTAGPITDLGGNLIGGDPHLGPLADNGGPTQTHLPLLGSPAIDAGSNTVCAAAPVNNVDQRGITRPIDGDGSGTATCDSGAVERNVALPTLSIDDVTQAEGNSGGPTSFVFTVTRAGDTTGPSTVHYTTVNGTAFGGIDYVTKSGTLTFITDDTEETIAVQVNGDWSYEANETFSVTLSSPTFASISDGSGLGTILNDDINPPSGLTATGVSMTQINLNWSDNSSDETAFYVERSPDGSTGWTEIGSVGANVTTYPDSTGLACGTTYYYRVRAYRSSDTHYSIYTATANGKTTLCRRPADSRRPGFPARRSI